MKNPFQMKRLQKSNFNYYRVLFVKKPFKHSRDFKVDFIMIIESTLEGDIEFLHPATNLAKFLNPNEICADNFFLY